MEIDDSSDLCKRVRTCTGTWQRQAPQELFFFVCRRATCRFSPSSSVACCRAVLSRIRSYPIASHRMLSQSVACNRHRSCAAVARHGLPLRRVGVGQRACVQTGECGCILPYTMMCLLSVLAAFLIARVYIHIFVDNAAGICCFIIALLFFFFFVSCMFFHPSLLSPSDLNLESYSGS